MGGKGKRSRGKRRPQQSFTQKKQVKPKQNTLLDICSCVYGEWGMLNQALSLIPDAVEGMQERYRVIVLDNGTPDWLKTEEDGTEVSVTAEEQAEAVKEKLRPGDSFTRLEENVGFPRGINTAISKGVSPLILHMSPDVFLTKGAIAKLVKDMDDPSIGFVAPMLLFPEEESPHGPSGAVQSAGITFNIRGDPSHLFMGWSPANPRVAVRREMQAITGACFITRRSLWNEIGGFSDVYGAGTFEDMEYCFNVRASGSKVVFNPQAVGYHYVGGSIKQGAGKQGFNLSLNSTIFKGRWAQHLQWDEYRYY